MPLNDSGLFEGLWSAPKAAEPKAFSLGGQSAVRNDGGRSETRKNNRGTVEADFASFLKAKPQTQVEAGLFGTEKNEVSAMPPAAPEIPEYMLVTAREAENNRAESVWPEVWNEDRALKPAEISALGPAAEERVPALAEEKIQASVVPPMAPPMAAPSADADEDGLTEGGEVRQSLISRDSGESADLLRSGPRPQSRVEISPALTEVLAGLGKNKVPAAQRAATPPQAPPPAASPAATALSSAAAPSAGGEGFIDSALAGAARADAALAEILAGPGKNEAPVPQRNKVPAAQKAASPPVTTPPIAAPSAGGEGFIDSALAGAARADAALAEVLAGLGKNEAPAPQRNKVPVAQKAASPPVTTPPMAAPSAGGEGFIDSALAGAARAEAALAEVLAGPGKNEAPAAQRNKVPAAQKAASLPMAPPPMAAPSAGGDEEDVIDFALARAARADAALAEVLAGPGKNKAPAAQKAASPPMATPPMAAPSAGGEDFIDSALARVARADAALAEVLAGLGKNEAPAAQGAAVLPEAQGPPPSALPQLTATLDFGRHGRPRDWNSLASGLLVRNRLNLAAGLAETPVLGRGEGADPAAVTAALDRARSVWPAPFRRRVGLGLVALGRPGLSANSMSAGAALLDSASTGEVLRDVLAGLKGELKILKLPPKAREDLGRILADSGVDRERLGRIMAGFGRDGISLSELNRQLAGLDLSGRGRGLIVTSEGLTELAQFLGSLGASAEVLDQVMNGLKPGQPLTGETLRDIFDRTEVGGLARNLSSGDLRSLAACLQKMGANPGDLEKLDNFLSRTSGQLESFLEFLDNLKESPALSGGKLEELKTLLEQVSRDDNLARTPVFNEILIKLQALGDSDIDDNFLNLSPALQALRGGISGAEDFSQFHGQNRGRENQERYRQALHAVATGQDGPAGAAVMAAEAGGYGGRSESLNRQIAQKIILSRRRGLYRLKMNLNPAELGRLDIELTVKNGALTANIRAENRSAYESLGAGVAELKKALAEGGVELAGLTLAHDDADSGQSFTAGLSELTAENRNARARAFARPGEVNQVI